MFRNGKRRPEEEDPLVPHGMVWYGTPEAPPEASDEFLESTVHYAQVMKMTRRRARAPAQQSREENGRQPEPATGTAGPAPIPWWRIPSPDPEAPAPVLSSPATAATPRPKPAFPSKVELTTPSPSRVAFNSPATSEVKNEVKEIKKEVKNDVRKEEPARTEARAWAGSAALMNFTRSSFAHSRRLAAHGKLLFSRAAAKVARAATSRPKPAFPSKVELTAPSPSTVASNRPATSDVNNEVKEIKKEVKNDVKKEEPARIEARAGAGSAAVTNFARSSLAHSRRLAAQGKLLFSRAAAKFIREQPASPLKPPRLRIVLTGLPLRTKIQLTRQLSEWKIWNPSVMPDTRLRNAMIMAAACAVVALFGVSLASHLASRYLPSHRLHPGSTAGAKIVSPAARASASAVAQASRSAVAAGPRSAENQKSPSTAAAAKSEEEKPSPHRREAHRKRHHTNDDDYVAPNTYKYYGRRGDR